MHFVCQLNFPRVDPFRLLVMIVVDYRVVNFDSLYAVLWGLATALLVPVVALILSGWRGCAAVFRRASLLAILIFEVVKAGQHLAKEPVVFAFEPRYFFEIRQGWIAAKWQRLCLTKL